MGKFFSKLTMYWLHFCAHTSTDMICCWLLWINITKFRVDVLAQLKVVPIWLLSSEKSGHPLRHLSEFSKLLEYAKLVSQQSTLPFLILSLKSEMYLQEFLSWLFSSGTDSVILRFMKLFFCTGLDFFLKCLMFLALNVTLPAPC